MPIKKRKGSDNYYVEFKFRGERIRESSGTSNAEEARRFEAELRKSLWAQDKLNEKPDRIWEEAVERYLLTRTKVDSIETTKDILRWLSQYLCGVKLRDINNDLWLSLVKKLREIGNRRVAGRGGFKPVSDSRINRYNSALHAVLSAAHEAGWVDGVPRLWKAAEPKKTVRWASRDEVVRLFAELPLHLAYPAAYHMLSGVRSSNGTNLLKSQVHWDLGLIIYDADEMKDDDIHAVPITPDIEAVLRDCWDDHPTHVFVTHHGKPWQGKFSNTAWYSALKRAGVERFTWHSWRHTWATWHRMNGTSLGDLQALGGWSDATIVQRYAHFNNDVLIRAAGNLRIGGTSGVPQKVPQSETQMLKASPSASQPIESKG